MNQAAAAAVVPCRLGDRAFLPHHLCAETIDFCRDCSAVKSQTDQCLHSSSSTFPPSPSRHVMWNARHVPLRPLDPLDNVRCGISIPSLFGRPTPFPFLSVHPTATVRHRQQHCSRRTPRVAGPGCFLLSLFRDVSLRFCKLSFPAFFRAQRKERMSAVASPPRLRKRRKRERERVFDRTAECHALL